MMFRARISLLWVACLLLVGLAGCAATKPIKGIPVREWPDDLRLPVRSTKSMIDPSLLRQTPPREHRVDAGDILGVYIEGVLGGRQEVPPVNFHQNFNSHSSLGFPIRVREDGTISLPLAKPISVRGLTMPEVEQALRTAYATGEDAILKKGNDRILVTLQRPRHYRVLVIRQESGNPGETAGRDGRLPANPAGTAAGKYGNGRTVDLPAYENDVLHALTETGGFPGLDAENVVYVLRRRGPEAGCRTGPSIPDSLNLRSSQRPDTNSRARNFNDSQKTGPVIRAQSPSIDVIPGEFLQHGGHSRSQRSTKNNLPSGPNLFGPPVTQPAPAARNIDVPAPYQSVDSDVAERLHPHLAPADWNPVPTAPANPETRSDRLPSEPTSNAPLVDQQQSSVSPPRPLSSGNSGTGAWGEHRNGDATISSPTVIRIPLRLFPGETPPFIENDVILQDGDVVVIESRDSDVFFTGGLLGGGRFRLPRDQDLDVVQALSLVQAERTTPLPTRAIGGVSALNQDVTASASDLIVLRQVTGQGQLAIRVNLYQAVRDPRERIFVQPGDHLVLQYTRREAFVAFLERHILDGVILGASSGLFFKK